MLSSEGLIDGSWDLAIHVTDLNVQKSVRVRGDTHVGGVMMKLVNALGVPDKDWSDHAMWWLEKNQWLLRTRSTLDQFGVHAGATLWFTPMHRNLRVSLPDLQVINMRVNFSSNVFNAVISICKKLRIRHPEELSLLRKLDRSSQRRSSIQPGTRRPTSINLTATSPDTCGGDYKEAETASADIDLGRSRDTLFDANEPAPSDGSKTSSIRSSPDSLSSLVDSPNVSLRDAVRALNRPQNYTDKTKINACWLDSSRSIMEQGVEENGSVMLRYKFSTFYDLEPKFDAVRINQIYEQARWSLICEHVQCTEEEMTMFAGLQLHIRLQSTTDLPLDKVDGATSQPEPVNDISAALDDLQMTLGGDQEPKTADIMQCPTLQDYLLYLKPKRFALKRYKKQYFVLSETQLTIRKTADEEQPLMTLNLRGCSVLGEANVAEEKFTIKLTTQTDPTEIWLRLNNLDQYASWLAALRLASRRRTMADVIYEDEVQSVLDLLRLRQTPSHDLDSGKVSAEFDDVKLQPEEFTSARVLRKIGRRQVTKRILEARANIRHMTPVEAKMTYIKAWQSLSECGHAYFLVNFKGSKKKDLLAVGGQRVVHLDLTTGRCLNAWPYDAMTSWAVNWDIQQVKIELENEGRAGDNEVAFKCLSADCKTVHEYIGGYVFLSMRSAEKNQTLNEELFQRLTGGWI